MTAIHPDIGDVNTTVVDISTSEDTATIVQTVGTITLPSLVVQFLQIILNIVASTFRQISTLAVLCLKICQVLEITVTDITFVQSNSSSTIDRTTLTATVCVTFDGRNAVNKGCTIQFTNNNIGSTIDISSIGIGEFPFVITYTALPSATIDITARTALDISIGCGHKGSRFIRTIIISACLISVVHRADGTGCINVLCYFTAKQANEGGTINITSTLDVIFAETTAIGIGSTEFTIIHIATNNSALVNANIGVILIRG